MRSVGRRAGGAETGSVKGNHFDNVALFRFELDAEGRVASVSTYDRDREAIKAFWAAVGAGAT